MSDNERIRIANALIEVLASAFPGDDILPNAVKDWVGHETSPAPNCAVCGRSIAARLAVQPGGEPLHLRLLAGKDAGSQAVCGPCLDAARDAFKPQDDRPVWDMILAQLERALALLPSEDAAVARDGLAKHPDTLGDATCVVCKKAARTVQGRAGGLCEKCCGEGRSAMNDLATRAEVEREDSRCPQCGFRGIAAGVVGIEFTEMTCLSCGHSQTCDVWELSDWRG